MSDVRRHLTGIMYVSKGEAEPNEPKFNSYPSLSPSRCRNSDPKFKLLESLAYMYMYKARYRDRDTTLCMNGPHVIRHEERIRPRLAGDEGAGGKEKRGLKKEKKSKYCGFALRY